MSTFKVQGQVHVYHLAGSLLLQKPEEARFMEQADRRRLIGLISAVKESTVLALQRCIHFKVV